MSEQDPVQPDSGQGGDPGDSPYADYLNRIPEEVRGEVEPVFRDWDANTTKKFQEHSSYREAWKPFEELGVQQRDPGEVQWALQFVDALQNPQAINTWFQGYAAENGLTPAQAAQQAEDEGLVDPQQAQWLEQQLQAQIGPVAGQLQELLQWRDAQEQQAQETQVRASISSEMEALKAKHPTEFSEAMVEKFIANHMSETDPRVAVQKAFADWQTVRSQIEKETLQAKVDVPQGAESGGNAPSGADPAKSLEAAGRQALEMLRAAKSM